MPAGLDLSDFDGLGEEGDLRQARPRGSSVEAPDDREHHAPRGKTPPGTWKAIHEMVAAMLVSARDFYPGDGKRPSPVFATDFGSLGMGRGRLRSL